MDAIDVLVVSPGTTPGWRRGDAELLAAFEQLGVSASACTPAFSIARHLRRTVLMTDLVEAAALRRETDRALRRFRPRAIVFSSPQAAMLQPRARLEGATAIRFDVPAAFNRRGAGSGLLRALERRAIGHVRLLLPIGVQPGREALAVARGKRLVALPIPVEGGADSGPRQPLALAYAGNPEKKGLDLLARAWGAAAPAGWRLVVTGIDARAGSAFLRARRVDEPPGLEWAGTLERSSYSELLGRATIYLSASRYEDYGIAQLEALAGGALLVTAPSDGPYEALVMNRELDPRLVARDLSPQSLAEAIETALAMSEEERLSYRRRARAHLAPHSREALVSRLKDDVLPALLGARETT